MKILIEVRQKFTFSFMPDCCRFILAASERLTLKNIF